MDAAEPARFQPTALQAAARGLYVGTIVAAVALVALAVLFVLAGPAPGWLWSLLAAGPPVLGVLGGALVGRRFGTEIDAYGIRSGRGRQPWNQVVDVRAERRGARTVVSVYLDSGASVQLAAPYSGGLFAADPRFELKVSALSHLWRSHRFGGLPS